MNRKKLLKAIESLNEVDGVDIKVSKVNTKKLTRRFAKEIYSLIDKGADVNAKHDEGGTALMNQCVVRPEGLCPRFRGRAVDENERRDRRGIHPENTVRLPGPVGSVRGPAVTAGGGPAAA